MRRVRTEAATPSDARVTRLGRLAAAVTGPLRYAVVATWVVIAVAATLYLPSIGGQGDLGLPVRDDAPPLVAERRAAELFGYPLLARTIVVQRDPSGLGTDARRRLLRRVVDVNAHRVPELTDVAAAVPLLDDAGVTSRAGQAGTTSVTYLLIPEASAARSLRLGRTFAAGLATPGAEVGVTGAAPARVEQFRAIEDRLPWVVLATLAMIALVVWLVFRSLLAPAVTLATAGLAYLVDLRVIGWVGERTGISATSDLEPVVAALLLGIVTDYALFYLFGVRHRLALGEPARDAARWAAARYTPIVATAGVTVAAGTGALLVGGVDFFRAFGPALALTALVGMLVASTLVPALLAIAGGRVVAPRARARPDVRGPLLVRLVTHRGLAVLAILLSLAGLLAAASGVREMRLGSGLTGGLPGDAQARVAAQAVDAAYPPGVRGPTELLLEAPGIGAATPQLAALARAIGSDPGVAAVLSPGTPVPAGLLPGVLVTRDRAAARMLIVLRDDPTEHRAIATLGRLRDAMPGRLGASGLPGARASFAGDTALARAAVRSTTSELLRVGAVAALVNLVLLAVFLRSLVAPVYLLAASALSVAAALGVTTYVFQDGLGQGQLVYFVPFASAVLLLALGSDYNIFLVGQIWDEDASDGMAAAVRRAAVRAGAPIAVAGFVLAASFGLLGAVPLDALRQIAFAMAAGVLIDAFVVRSVLVPAMIALLGDASRWPSRAWRKPAPPAPAGTAPAPAPPR